MPSATAAIDEKVEHPDRRRPAREAAGLRHGARGARPEPRVRASSGGEALREVLQREFAVILLDVNMPDIDGFETAALIRQYKRSAAHADHLHHRLRRRDADRAGATRSARSTTSCRRWCREMLRSKVKVFVELHRMQRQRAPAGRRARRAGARAEAARRVAEENDRRSDFLVQRQPRAERLARHDVGMHALVELVVPQLASLALVMLGSRRRTACRPTRGRRPHARGERPVAIADDAASLDAPQPSRAGRQRRLEPDRRSPALATLDGESPLGRPRRRLGCAAVGGAARHRRPRCSACCWSAATPAERSRARLGGARRAGHARGDRVRERTAVQQPAGRDRRAARRRGRAAGSEPAQGRVPRDAVARAAQPARADPQRARGDPPRRAARPEARLGDRRHGAADAAPDAAGRGTARRGAHQPGQDRAERASRST